MATSDPQKFYEPGGSGGGVDFSKGHDVFASSAAELVDNVTWGRTSALRRRSWSFAPYGRSARSPLVSSATSYETLLYGIASLSPGRASLVFEFDAEDCHLRYNYRLLSGGSTTTTTLTAITTRAQPTSTLSGLTAGERYLFWLEGYRNVTQLKLYAWSARERRMTTAEQ